MGTMKAALYSGIEKIAIHEVERQPPPPGYLMVAMRQVGICGTDLHAYFGHLGQTPGRAQGHEVCGVVAEIGEGVTGFAVGDHVVMEYFSHCGECVYCRAGSYMQCLKRLRISGDMHAGFAEYTNVHNSGVYKLPVGMTDEEGALVEPLAVAVRALAQARATYQSRILVVGGGTIGLLCLAVAKAMGVREVMITAKYPQQARIAHELGADQIIDIRHTDVKEHVHTRTGGMGVDVVIETVGGGRNFDDAVASVRRRGTVVLMAYYPQPVEVALWPVVFKELTVTSSLCYDYSGMHSDFQTAIDLLASGKVAAAKVVTHRFELREIAEAFAVAANKESGAVKVHVVERRDAG